MKSELNPSRIDTAFSIDAEAELLIDIFVLGIELIALEDSQCRYTYHGMALIPDHRTMESPA